MKERESADEGEGMPASGQPTTLGLLRDAREGREEAMERLYEKLWPLAMRWAHGRLPRAARRVMDTEDLVQETLAATLARVKSLDPQSGRAIYCYLRAALRNRLLREMRRAVQQSLHEKSLPSNVELKAPGPFERAAGAEAYGRYEAALERLSETERSMVVGRIEFGLSWKEIAEIAEKPSPDAARIAVSRILVRIAREIGAER